jgi:hypothetical protein
MTTYSLRLSLLTSALLVSLSLSGCESLLSIFSDASDATDGDASADDPDDTNPPLDDTQSPDPTTDASPPPTDTIDDDTAQILAELRPILSLSYTECRSHCDRDFSCNLSVVEDLWDNDINKCFDNCEHYQDAESPLFLGFQDPVACAQAQLAHSQCISATSSCRDYSAASAGQPGNLCEYEDTVLPLENCIWVK